MAKKEEREAPLSIWFCPALTNALAGVGPKTLDTLVDHRRRAPVLRPGRFGGTSHGRALLAIGNGPDPGRVYTLRKQEVTGGSGATLAKGKVVFTRATLIAVAFDGDGQRRVGVQERRLTHQRAFGVSRQGRTVKGEVNRVANCGERFSGSCLVGNATSRASG